MLLILCKDRFDDKVQSEDVISSGRDNGPDNQSYTEEGQGQEEKKDNDRERMTQMRMVR